MSLRLLLDAVDTLGAELDAAAEGVGHVGRALHSAAQMWGQPGVTVTVGAGRDPSAENYARIFTRTDDTVGMSRVDARAGANMLAAFTNLLQSTGFNTPDRMLSDVYALIFASRRGLKLPGYTIGGR